MWPRGPTSSDESRRLLLLLCSTSFAPLVPQDEFPTASRNLNSRQGLVGLHAREAARGVQRIRGGVRRLPRVPAMKEPDADPLALILVHRRLHHQLGIKLFCKLKQLIGRVRIVRFDLLDRA